MRLLLAATLALASASALGQDAPAAEETKAATGNKRASTAVNLVAALVPVCAEETDKDACNALQAIQSLAECGLNAPNPSACDQPIAEAKAQWETPPAEAEAE